MTTFKALVLPRGHAPVVVCHEQSIEFGDEGHSLRRAKTGNRMDFFAFAKIDNLKRVIAQRADEQSFVDGIEGKMIYSTLDAG